MSKRAFWTKFWELFEKSIIVQSFVTGALVLTICVLYGLNYTNPSYEVPTLLKDAMFLVLGFWFGSKVGYNAASAPKS